MNILLVGKDSPIFEKIQSASQKQGLPVSATSSPDEAKKLLAELGSTEVFVDLVDTFKDQFEVIGQLSSANLLSSITAIVTPHQAKNAMLAGATEFWEHPISDTTAEARLLALGKRLADKNEHFAFLDAMGEGLSVLNTNYQISFQNKAHKKIMGDHGGRVCYEAYQNRTEPCPDCPVTRTFEDLKKHEAINTVSISIDGPNEKLVLTTSTPFFDEKSTLVGAIKVVRDITAEKASRDELRLKEVIFQNSVAAESTADSNGIINRCNRAFLDAWGRTRSCCGTPIVSPWAGGY